MIANFFQSLNSSSTEYLLISGQATVLYGAATFSEDIDLWVKPTTANAGQFLTCLRSSRARYYKLTPPWKLDLMLRGHGFHFLVPDREGQQVYLDVMGAPPRVDSFEDAANAAVWLETDWGTVRVIGIRELIQLKKTQRLEDYPIIGRNARRITRLKTRSSNTRSFGPMHLRFVARIPLALPIGAHGRRLIEPLLCWVALRPHA